MSVPQQTPFNLFYCCTLPRPNWAISLSDLLLEALLSIVSFTLICVSPRTGHWCVIHV